MTVTSYGSFSFLDNGSRNGCLWLLGILCSYGNIGSRSAFCWLWLLVSCSTIEDRYGSHKAGMVRQTGFPTLAPFLLLGYWGYLAMAPLLVLFFLSMIFWTVFIPAGKYLGFNWVSFCCWNFNRLSGSYQQCGSFYLFGILMISLAVALFFRASIFVF